MPDKPLQPFAPPTSFANLPGGIPTSETVVVWFFYLALVIWIIYTLVAVYHWLKYSHASIVAFPAIALHLFISFALVSYALSGTFSLL